MTRTIAVVDDDDSFRVAVGRILRLKGFGVVEAGDRQAALDLLRNQTAVFDVLLLDVMLQNAPAADVFAAATAARPDVLVILTSAYPREHAQRLIGAPADRPFIRKPYRVEELIRLFEQTSVVTPGDGTGSPPDR